MINADGLGAGCPDCCCGGCCGDCCGAGGSIFNGSGFGGNNCMGAPLPGCGREAISEPSVDPGSRTGCSPPSVSNSCRDRPLSPVNTSNTCRFWCGICCPDGEPGSGRTRSGPAAAEMTGGGPSASSPPNNSHMAATNAKLTQTTANAIRPNMASLARSGLASGSNSGPAIDYISSAASTPITVNPEPMTVVTADTSARRDFVNSRASS